MKTNMNFPEWISIKPFDKLEYKKTCDIISSFNIKTVCIEANCPNRYECFSKKTATFMILGNVCTRNCRYCNIRNGKPKKVDEKEPEMIAGAAKKLGINYVVITCTTRDDLSDCGADQFAKIVCELKKTIPHCKVELLISDLNGNSRALKEIINSNPNVINHNIDTVKELFPLLRPKGNYIQSLNILRKVKEYSPKMKTKSGIIVGMGESKKQIINSMKDLRNAECDILTIGQYLQPSPKHIKIKRFYTPNEFYELKKIGESLGFKHVESGPLVRSSYHASEY